MSLTCVNCRCEGFAAYTWDWADLGSGEIISFKETGMKDSCVLPVLRPENIVQAFRDFRGAAHPGLKPRVYRAKFIPRALRRG